MKTFRLAWRQLLRDLGSGDVRILVMAVMLAVIAVTAVGFVTDRTQRALVIEANRLLGADAVVRSDTPITGSVRAAADADGLKHAETVAFDSMVRVGNGSDANLRLGELRVLGNGFPLRGSFRLTGADGHARTTTGIPAPGTVWISRAGAQTLGGHIGDSVAIGDAKLRIAALVLAEPDASLDFFNTAPRVFLNLQDLPATGLVQEGSRIEYRLLVAGEAAAVERYSRTVAPELQKGQQLEKIGQTRPEVRSALDSAGRFLGLAAILSVVLAAVAVAMAARRHSARHLSGAAVMRCLGASQGTLVGIHVGELALLGFAASAVGVAIAFLLQWAVGDWLAAKLALSIPPADWKPAVQGLGVGIVVVIAFGAPPVLALRRVPTLRVLRRDVDGGEPSAWIVALAGFAGLALLLWWKAGSAMLGGVVLLGVAGTLAILAAFAWVLIEAVRRLRPRLRGSLRYGLANVSRRAGTSIAQVAALGLGLMALLLLTFVRTDLLDQWRVSLSTDTPNRFIINAQADQAQPMAAFIAAQGLPAPTLFPIVRGRLVALNGKPGGAILAKDDPMAKQLAEREFNLSSVAQLRSDNRIVAGRFWPQAGKVPPQLSVEQRFAKSMGWKLGDRIAFDIAGQRFEAPITSLRMITWESFKPNFFVLASPGSFDGFPASYITAVRVPADATHFTADLVERFPNLTVIDVDAVLQQVRTTGDQVSMVVQVVFWFSLAAGILVLLAAIGASQDERLLEGGVMRVLGASRRQMRFAQASEFAAIGLLAGMVAAIAASILSGLIATRVFHLTWHPDATLTLAGALAGTGAALFAGMFATRRVLDAPPSSTLRELQE